MTWHEGDFKSTIFQEQLFNERALFGIVKYTQQPLSPLSSSDKNHQLEALPPFLLPTYHCFAAYSLPRGFYLLGRQKSLIELLYAL